MADAPTPAVRRQRWKWACALAAAVLLAAGLRLPRLGQFPPGLNQDEAANAWNACCVLRTGMDQTGAAWPIFYSRYTGSNSSTLYLYALLPFQAIGGMNVTTTRLPSAVGGIAVVLLMYYLGARWFDRRVGLVAAAMYAINPWAITLGRWGIEGGLCPLLGIGPPAMMVWANLFGDDAKRRGPRPILAALAGLATGAACYGYPAIRMFLPIFIMLAILATWRTWRGHLQTPRGRSAVAAFVLGGAITFGPLLWMHLTDPQMNRRGEQTLIWKDGKPPLRVAKDIATRYFRHFQARFLFRDGEPAVHIPIADHGVFQWYDLPFLLFGTGAIVALCRTSPGARILLMAVLAYPTGDILAWNAPYGTPSMLRSAPGIWAMVLLSAVGAVYFLAYLWRKWRPAGIATLGAAALAAMVLTLVYIRPIFGRYVPRTDTYHNYAIDVQQVCRWLRPRWERYDAVFCTTTHMNLPYLTSLVHLGYDPRQWFRDERDYYTPTEFDWYVRYGKMHFLYPGHWERYAEALRSNGRPDRALFLVRPGELNLTAPIYRIPGPDDKDVLWLIEEEL